MNSTLVVHCLFIPTVSERERVPSLQFSGRGVRVSGKTNSRQPTVLPTSSYNSSVSPPYLASGVSLARSVYSESRWAQRTRPIITKWRAAALQIYIHSTVPHAFNIDGPASSEDLRVILLLLCVFLFVKWAEGKSSVRDGWESRHPRRSCGDMWVFAALCSSMSQCCALCIQ